METKKWKHQTKKWYYTRLTPSSKWNLTFGDFAMFSVTISQLQIYIDNGETRS